VTHEKYKTPHIAMVSGALLGLTVMLVIWFVNGGGGAGETQLGDDIIGSVLLNMAVFGAMLSYIMQALSFIILRRNLPNIERPFRSPVGIPGAVLTIIIAAVTLFYQLQDPNFYKGVIWVVLWCAVGIAYFALIGRHKLIMSPEEEFAMAHRRA
jgi:ethanolamine permease